MVIKAFKYINMIMYKIIIIKGNNAEEDYLVTRQSLFLPQKPLRLRVRIR